MKNDTPLHDVALLRAKIEELESTVHTLRQSLSESESTIQSLVEKLNLARRKRYGASSETMPPQDLEFNEAENHAETDDINEEVENDRKKSPQQDKGSTSSESRRGRPKLPEDLPREYVVVDVPDSDKVCTAASQRFVKWVKAPVKNWCTFLPNCTLK